MNRMHELGGMQRIALGSGLALIMLFSSCTPDEPETTVPLVKDQVTSVPPTPLFDPDSAYAFVKNCAAHSMRRLDGCQAEELRRGCY